MCPRGAQDELGTEEETSERKLNNGNRGDSDKCQSICGIARLADTSFSLKF